MLFIWTGFICFILLLLALDLGVFHRKAHAVAMKEALGWSAVWVGVALLFSIFVYFAYGHHWLGIGTGIDAVDGRPNDGATAVVKYLTGYVIEKSLSVDNIFVIAVIFAFFHVPAAYQHRVLFWGILGALVMRGGMIFAGAQLLARYHWLLYVFGGFLILTAAKMLFLKTGESDLSKNPLLRLLRRFFPITDEFHGSHFLTRRASDGVLALTPLAPALLMVETTDVVFAADSIPAIFAITADPFLVFTSNVFAILGLRSLYFALAGLMHKFRYLKPALALILALVGVKMLAAEWLKQQFGPAFTFYTLGGIAVILAGGIVASILANRRTAQSGTIRPSEAPPEVSHTHG